MKIVVAFIRPAGFNKGTVEGEESETEKECDK